MTDDLGDKLKGTTEEAAGKVLEQWGEKTDNHEWEVKGKLLQKKGTYHKTKGKLEDVGEDVKDPFTCTPRLLS